MNKPPFDRLNVLFEHGDECSEQCIGVIVTLYNYEDFIIQCLASIASQDHPELELIVVDDRSTDDSVDAVTRWLETSKERFRRVLFVSHLHNRGLAMARNTGIASAVSRCVFIMDADNALYPSALSTLHRVLSSTNASAAYCQLEHFGEETGLGKADVLKKEFLVQGNYIDAMALFDKATLITIGGYRHMSGWEDYDVWCRFIELDLRAVFVPNILCRYRVHGTSMMRTENERDLQGLITQMLLRHPWLNVDVHLRSRQRQAVRSPA